MNSINISKFNTLQELATTDGNNQSKVFNKLSKFNPNSKNQTLINNTNNEIPSNKNTLVQITQ